LALNLTPELYLIRNSEAYAIPEMLWELVGGHHWLRLIAVHLESGEEMDLDLDLPRKVWDEMREVIEEHPHSTGITFLLHLETDSIGRASQLKLERVIEKPTIPNLQTEWVWKSLSLISSET
jgi:hypothetical protein